LTCRLSATYLAVDEFEITRALGIAVSSTIFSSSFVGRVLLQATVCIHGDEVERPIEAAGEGRQVNVEGEFEIRGQLEHFISSIILHQVVTRSNVRRVRPLGNELQLERISAGCDAISRLVVGSIKRAVRGALLVVATHCLIPLITGIAVGVPKQRKFTPVQTEQASNGPALDMKPAPVRVDHNFPALARAATFGSA